MSQSTIEGWKLRARSTPWVPLWATRTVWPPSSSIIAMLSAASSLSSTTSTRWGSATGSGAGVTTGPDASRGRCRVNVEPLPGPSLWTSTAPPCISMNDRTNERPSPRPPRLRSRLRSACENGSKRRAIISGSTPMPSSATVTVAEAWAAPASGATVTAR